MFPKSENLQLTSFLLDYTDDQLSEAELKSFQSLLDYSPKLRKEATDGKSIRNALRTIPKKGVQPGFDQRMAAKFAMELERETTERNRSRIGAQNMTII